MVGLSAGELLAGPRGRVLCLAVAHRLDERVWSAWLQASWHLGDPARRDELVGALGALDADLVAAWTDPLSFAEPMDEAVTHAMYWQPPHDEDVLAGDPDVVTALYPIASAITSAAAAAWWNTPADLDALRYTSRYDQQPTPPTLSGAAARLRQWRERTITEDARVAAERPADPVAPYSGTWWSTPAPAALVTTTRPLPGLGSVRLIWEEDSPGEDRAAIWPVATTRAPRVWEVDRPDAWAGLVERYPLDVTHARRHDWYRTTGRDGAWCIPDWPAVAADWDAVHVSVAGYLTTATRALPLAGGRAATVLAGWNPDETWWLTDVLAASTDQPQTWHNPHRPAGPDFAWRPTLQ